MKVLLYIVLSCLILSYPLGRFFLKNERRELDGRLHALAHDAILSTKRVYIAGFPKAFNPSLIPYKEGYLLSFRNRHRQKHSYGRKKDVSFLGVVQLGSDFRVVEKSAQLLDVRSYAPHSSCTAEDARLLKIDNRIFIFFNDFSLSGDRGYALYLAELVEKEGRFAFKEPAKHLYYARALPIEKNWSPFSVQDKLYLIYSDAPRVILEVDIATGQCREVARYPTHYQWNWGEIRGGTPALQMDETLLTFFHSSISSNFTKNKRGRLYVMGAYLFDAHFPFTPQKITRVPLGEKEYYTKENKRNVIFPSGLVIQEPLIHVAWGKNDQQIHITTFDKSKLLHSFVDEF